MVKLVGEGRVKLLLDGFDEIGSQSWTGEAARLKEIRAKSLKGVKDLIQRCEQAGLLVAGREHYFSSDEEMVSCLGLNDGFAILRCPEEFSDEETRDYIQRNTSLTAVPAWMPKKPLICQLFTKIDAEDLTRISEAENGEVEFFENFLAAIAKREQRIHPSIDPGVLRNVLLNLAVRTRSKPGIEEITPNEINEAFYEVSGHTPLDESAVMLQRLPYLGRVGSGNPNRAFIDGYAKSGLRGIALADAIRDNDKKIPAQKWQQPLGDFGARVLAGKVHKFSDARKYAKLCSSHGNGQVVGDVMCAELEEGRDAHDFSSMRISGVVASTWDFSGKKVVGLVADTCQVGLVELEDTEFADCSFVDSDFQRVSGVASAVAMPTSFKNSCEYSSFTDIDSSARISSLKISPQHKTLLVIIQKLFFQRGKARQEQSLLRGSSAFWDAKAADIAIRYMLKNEIIREAPGKAGKLYGPQLSHKNRMRKLKDGMSTSGDELWNLVAKP